MLIEKENPSNILDTIPRILVLNAGGEALDWISYEAAATYYAKGKVLWSLGTYEVNLRGGTNAKTGLQSTLKLDTIIAIKNDVSPSKFRVRDPLLTNVTLFERDRNLCAYCGVVFKRKDLTRDHVHPVSKGGKDVWENVVTACGPCNQGKGNDSLEKAGMQLIYVPYTPTHNEHLILKNRNLLADQMDYLIKGVSKHSRILQELN